MRNARPAALATLCTILAIIPAFGQSTWQSGASLAQPSYGLGAAFTGGKLYAISGFATTRVATYDPVANSWSERAPLPKMLQYFGTAVIHGKIYVAGGDTGGSGDVATLYVYDPALDAWTTKAPLPGGARWAVGAAEIDGKLFVVGGQHGGSLTTVEMYDPNTDAWTTKTPMPHARSGPAAVGVDGLLYVVGGTDASGYVSAMDIYDPATDTWSSGSAISGMRQRAGAIDGKIYVVGGGTPPYSVAVYDPSTNTWTTDTSMPTARHDLGVAVDPSTRKFYAVGGYADPSGGTTGVLEILTPAPAPDAWSAAPSMPTSRQGAASGVIDGRLYVVGGSNGGNQANITANEMFDPRTSSWTTKASVGTSRTYTGSAVIDGKLYVVGGCVHSDCSIVSNALDIYDPHADAWTSGAVMPTPRYGTVAAAIDGKLYVAGGNSGTVLRTLEVYDPASNQWSTGPAMSVARYDGAGVAFDDRLYVIGGDPGTGATSSVEVYNPLTNSWSASFDALTRRVAARAAVSNGVIHYIGGQDATGAIFSSVEALNPASGWTSTSPMVTPREFLMTGTVNNVIYAIGGMSAATLHQFYVGTTTVESLGATTLAPALTPTTVSVTSSANPAAGGTNVTFTANVYPASAAPPGTGGPGVGATITFSEGSTILAGPIALSAGLSVATFRTSSLNVGTHVIAASYSGNSNFAAAQGTITQTITVAATTSALSLGGPAVVRQFIPLDVQITPGAGFAGTAQLTGTYAISEGASQLATGTVSTPGQVGFNAVVNIIESTAGQHQLTLSYSGDANYAPSSSAFTFNVDRASTSMSLSADATNATAGQTVTFTAMVLGSGASGGATNPNPTGTVSFVENGTALGTGTMNSAGSATFSTSSLSVGNHSIAAQYGGDSNYTGSNATAVSISVMAIPTTTTVTSSPNPSTAGVAVVFNVSIMPSGAAPPNSGGPMSSGTLTFTENGNVIGGPFTLANGFAGFSTRALSVGSHTIVAQYSGNSVFASSQGSTSQVVNRAPTTATMTANGPGSLGQPLPILIRIAPQSFAGSNPLSGTYTVADGLMTLVTGTVVTSGPMGFSVTSTIVETSAGSHTLTLTYSGDANYAPVTTSTQVMINPAVPLAGLTSQPNPSNQSQMVTFSASIGAPTFAVPAGSIAQPTGNVTLMEGGAIVAGPMTLTNGGATFTTSSLSPGTHSITVHYNGDSNYTAIDSAPVSQTISAATQAGTAVNLGPFAGSPISSIFLPAALTRGFTTVMPVSAASIGPLPFGTRALPLTSILSAPRKVATMSVNGIDATATSDSGVAFNVSSTSVLVPPYVLTFTLPNVTDASVFADVRIYETINGTPVDVTVRFGPDAPSFSNKTIHAMTFVLGTFVVVQIVDHTPPVIANASATPNTLAPTGKMVSVTIGYDVSDDYTPAAAIRTFLTVTGNNRGEDHEPVVIDTHHVLLSARAGGTPRTYTITITAIDAVGNASSSNVQVTVSPHGD